MKTRKSFLVLVLVVILLLGTVIVVSAKNNILVTGGVNNTFFGMGWEWIDVNISLDPVTLDADGIIRYRVYAYDDDNPKYWESWVGEPVCGALGEIDGIPTVALVTKIIAQKNIDPSWVGKYMKTTISDGGQNASEDLIGIVVWDFQNNTPVDYQPLCDFEEPMVIYPSLNGNLTIHE